MAIFVWLLKTDLPNKKINKSQNRAQTKRTPVEFWPQKSYRDNNCYEIFISYEMRSHCLAIGKKKIIKYYKSNAHFVGAFIHALESYESTSSLNYIQTHIAPMHRINVQPHAVLGEFYALRSGEKRCNLNILLVFINFSFLQNLYPSKYTC